MNQIGFVDLVWNYQLKNWNCCTKQTQHKKKTNRTNEKNIRAACITADLRLTWNERIIWALDRMLLLLLLLRLRLRLNAAYGCIVQRSLSTFAAIAVYSSSVFLVECVCVCVYGMRMSSSVQFSPMFVAFVVCFRLLLLLLLFVTSRPRYVDSRCKPIRYCCFRYCNRTLIRKRTTAWFRMFLSCVRYGHTHFVYGMRNRLIQREREKYGEKRNNTHAHAHTTPLNQK